MSDYDFASAVKVTSPVVKQRQARLREVCFMAALLPEPPIVCLKPI